MHRKTTSQIQKEHILRLQQQRANHTLTNPTTNTSHGLALDNNVLSNNSTPSNRPMNKPHQQAIKPQSTGNLSQSVSSSSYNSSKPGVMAGSGIFTLVPYKNRKDTMRKSVLSKYEILGYIASGTYGRVYKAKSKDTSNTMLFAIKKFKADKEGDVICYTGISQSAAREMALCRELNNKNITKLIEIILENKAIYMVFQYAEHDLLQIIHFHSHPDSKPIPEQTIKSIMWQVLNGVSYLHQNWVLHRDLKPANIMVTSSGIIKIGDLGLARKFNNPLQSLYTGDKVVVTIWYRAPELLLGGRHYTPAIDLWAVGCIFAELLALRPIFKGEEAKMDNKKNVPFQRNQMQKIVEILGTPTVEKWSSLNKYPEFQALGQVKQFPNNLQAWYQSIGGNNKKGLQLLSNLLEYDPGKRLTSFDSLLHSYFLEPPKVSGNIFENLSFKYPQRRIHTADSDITATQSNPNNTANKRGYNNDNQNSQRKKQK
ncbi:hypothetical protein WICMUC_001862 [Wickerhamomyces mucosus]|uniref:Cyclin-dependent kinase 8 n=1 Tax=Wickerhamomyces mucosus TaxID=1378264 RepID=A0A9P8PS44_9ASCO|nr:hypothetical protein WICMUC_001862 [Wickerhamomyces mucosus]